MHVIAWGCVGALLAGLGFVPTGVAAQSADPCSGHQLLDMPRAEDSCLSITPTVFPSPDLAVRAIVYPVGMDLHASADIESRVVIRGDDAKMLDSKDYASPRGTNGYYVVRAAWSPDSQFFVYSMSSSGGHSPEFFPVWVYAREQNFFVNFSKLVGERPTVSDTFRFSGPHTLTTTILEKIGSEKQVPVTVDLSRALAPLAPPAAN